MAEANETSSTAATARSGPRALISLRDVAAAWVCVGALALGAFVVAPSGPRGEVRATGTSPIAVGMARSDIAPDGFEDAADRAATLAGIEPEPPTATATPTPLNGPYGATRHHACAPPERSDSRQPS
jgi:hypothetical protein